MNDSVIGDQNESHLESEEKTKTKKEKQMKLKRKKKTKLMATRTELTKIILSKKMVN